MESLTRAIMLEFFENDTQEEDLPFIEDYLKHALCVEGELFKVKEVWETKRGGLLIKTDHFVVHYDPKSKIKGLLIEALDHYVASFTGGYELLVSIDTSQKKKCRIAADFDVVTFWAKDSKKWYPETSASEQSDESAQANPFIPKNEPAPKSTAKGRRARA